MCENDGIATQMITIGFYLKCSLCSCLTAKGSMEKKNNLRRILANGFKLFPLIDS